MPYMAASYAALPIGYITLASAIITISILAVVAAVAALAAIFFKTDGRRKDAFNVLDRLLNFFVILFRSKRSL